MTLAGESGVAVVWEDTRASGQEVYGGQRADIDWTQETRSRQEQGDEAILEQGEFEEAAGHPDNQQNVWV